MKIIDELDPRYNLLPEVFEKYDWDNIVFHEGNWLRYYIAPELVVTDFIPKSSNQVRKVPRQECLDDDNWVSSKILTRDLNIACNLTTQEYFDLVILHINDTEDRPKCVLCGNPVPWGGRFSWGYNQSVWWYDVRFTYCSNSHAKKFQADNADSLFPNMSRQISQWMKSGWTVESKVSAARSRFMSHSSKVGVFYITLLPDNKFKYGISHDLTTRMIMGTNMQYEYLNPHILLESDSEELANLEARIKLEFEAREILDTSELTKFFKTFKSNIASRPVSNPFY